MKKRIILLIGLFLIPFLGYSQEKTQHRTLNGSISTAGKDTVIIFQEFSGSRFNRALSAVSFSPSDDFGFTDCTAWIYIDSVATVKPTADSLQWKIERIDDEGQVIGEALYVNFQSSGASATLTTAVKWNTFTPSNRLSTDKEIMWVDLRGEFENWAGIKHSIIDWDNGVSRTLTIKFHVNQVR